ncbi:MAG: hypothetical protein M1816_007539 [Peltula sp. TS41687]|nr:MAG: hypothetical protein M1816_007539 [Peltula sp. TS41687]
MAPQKHYQLMVISSDSDASDYGENFIGNDLSPSKILPLRQKGALSRNRNLETTAQTPVNGDLIKMDISVDHGDLDVSNDIPMDHNAGEADDEDEDLPLSRKTVDASKSTPRQTGIASYFQQRPGGVENRPKGRFWLDTVQIPPRQTGPEQSPATKMTRSTRQSLTKAATDPRQTNLVCFLGKANPKPQSSPLPRIQLAENKSSPESINTPAAPTVGVAPGSGSNRLRSTAKDVTRRQSTRRQSTLRAGSATFDPISLDSSDDEILSSPASSYVDVAEETADSDLYEHTAEDGVDDDSAVQSSDDEAEEYSSAASVPAKRKRESKQVTLALSGQLTDNGAAESKPAKQKKTRNPQKVERNSDSWTYKLGIDTSLTPIHEIEDIFYDMTAKGRRLGFDKALHHLAGRKLRVATMCSGTESPVLALGLISESLAKMQSAPALHIEHQFSAEIVPFKQAYIERTFSPPIIFRDIRELETAAGEQLDGKTATTAYGATVAIPGDIDLLVAGFSCVDFSNLNIKKRDLKGGGESGDTFSAVVHYAITWRPALIVLENVYNAPWESIRSMWQEDAVGYASEFVKLDTKQYYIPHTRQRGYMLCIDRRRYKKADKLVKDWAELMTKLRRPASSPIEAFLLDEDDPRVQRGREELSKGIAGEDRGPREVDWTRCQGRHQDYRSDLFLGPKRPMTGWQDNGSCKMPDYAWADWGVKQVERIWDTLEISWLRNARRGFDSQYKTRVWELSQNIDRFVDPTPFGLTGCITPTGSPFITNRGGPMVGLEALSMQGLPIDKLLLTRENHRQLQDLAGNAMTSTVVGAAMLGALIVGYEALEKGDGQAMAIDDVPDVTDHICAEENLISHKLDLAKYRKIQAPLVLGEAYRSSRLCLCEGRALMTSKSIQRCKLCGHTTCVKCGGNPTHDYELLTPEEISTRLGPASFEQFLKEALPMRLSLSGLPIGALEDLKLKSGAEVNPKDWVLLTKAIRSALGAELRFHSLKRAQVWTVFYDSPTSRMELILDPTQAEWRLFAKPAPTEIVASRTRELLQRPFARMRPSGDNLLAGVWQFCIPTIAKFKITLEGAGKPARCWESKLGLTEERFAEKKVWPTIRVTVDNKALRYLDHDVSGEYKWLENCGMASGSLHKRQDKQALPLFFFLDPTRLGNPVDDCFVFSSERRRLNYGESRQIIAQLKSSWRQSAVKGAQSVECQVFGRWVDCHANLQPVGPVSAATFQIPPPAFQVDFCQASCETATAMLSCHVPLSGDETVGWKKGPWIEISKRDEQAFFKSFAWLTERVRHLPGLELWKELNLPGDLARCQKCAPDAPPVKWKIHEAKLTPYEDPQKAGPFERALKQRPAPFITQVRIDENNVGRLRIGLNVLTLAHRALANLPMHGASSDVAVAWRLSTDYFSSPKVPIPKFSIKSNKSDSSCGQPPSFKFKLRPEQLRSLKWMLDQESPEAPAFTEEEAEEAMLPQLGWRAEARATKKISVRGGVLADQVGYGKTATTLGLIDAQFRKHGSTPPKGMPGKISIKATLIVVPTQLVHQWSKEVTKFLGIRYKILSIKQSGDIGKFKVRDFQNADMIIVSWMIFNNETYLNKVAEFAALPEMPSSSGRAFEAWFSKATERVAEHVDLLRTDGGPSLEQTLKAKLISTENDEKLKEVIPSKRLRGAAYAAAKAAREAKAAKPSDQSPDKKRQKTKHGSDSSEEPAKPKPAAATKRKNDLRGFGLGSAAVKKDWTNMTSPLFQMFHFNRLVVDEYTYLDGKNHTCITQLQANTRWVLSGTPPLGDFADVKTIAIFLGINLGVDDDTSTVMRASNIKAMQKERTDVEKFQAFKQGRSSAWHQRRHEVAQQFLDQFVRQNIAEIDEIPFVEDLRPIVLPAAERAIYLELNQHLMAQDMRIRKGRAKTDNDREKRLNQVLGESKSPEEALLKRCSHFTLEDLTEKRQNAVQACDIIVAERRGQYSDLVKDLRRSLRRAVLLKDELPTKRDRHYEWWVESVPKNIIGDLNATGYLRQLIDNATKKYEGRGRRGPTKAQQGKGELNAKEKEYETDEGPAEIVDSTLTSEPQKLQALRDLAGHLRRLATELASRTRSLRFFEVVRELQRAPSGGEISKAAKTCSKCKTEVALDSLSVMGMCGHTACANCLIQHQKDTECIAIGCNAQAVAWSVLKATELGDEDRETSVGRHYGRKLEAVVKLIKHEIPKDDQVILFVQFNDLMLKVSKALADNGISHHCLDTGSRKSAGSLISDFQDNTSSGKKKVLMLNVSDESASGANLTNANHIIFLSPLLVTNQYQYDSATTQAIGRARRYGQKKVVHIYRFISLKTIDVDILQDRTGKMVVKEDGVVKLRKVTDAERKDLESLGGGALRSPVFSDSD